MGHVPAQCRKPKKWRTRRHWDQTRKRELSDFIGRMMRKFSGVDDEHLLRWIDRLKASEPPAASARQASFALSARRYAASSPGVRRICLPTTAEGPAA